MLETLLSGRKRNTHFVHPKLNPHSLPSGFGYRVHIPLFCMRRVQDTLLLRIERQRKVIVSSKRRLELLHALCCLKQHLVIGSLCIVISNDC